MRALNLSLAGSGGGGDGATIDVISICLTGVVCWFSKTEFVIVEDFDSDAMTEY